MYKPLNIEKIAGMLAPFPKEENHGGEIILCEQVVINMLKIRWVHFVSSSFELFMHFFIHKPLFPGIHLILIVLDN